MHQDYQDFFWQEKLKLNPEQEKIHELEKKLKETELECDIVKKAISIFSK